MQSPGGLRMLRRAENVWVSFLPSTFFRNGWLTLHVGRKVYNIAKIKEHEYADMCQTQRTYPVLIGMVGERSYWQFQDRFFSDNEGLDASAVHALLVIRQQRLRQRVDRAQQTMAMGAMPREQNVRG